MDPEILCGDCLSILPRLELDPAKTVIITDPPWPGTAVNLCRGEDPAAVFARAAAHFPWLARRAVVVLGSRTDPRLLAAVPMPFLRVAYLRYAVPRYRGSILDGGNLAYVYGDGFLPGNGQRVLPGEVTHVNPGARASRERGLCGWEGSHPCELAQTFGRWLVANYTRPDMTVLDPFAGSGTILAAAVSLGRRALGIELELDRCEVARRRLAAVQRPLLVV